MPEELGGQGAGLVELAVVSEELGRAAAVGPWDTGSVVAAVIATGGGPALAKEVLPALADGSSTASLVVPTATHDGRAVHTAGLTGSTTSDGGLVVDGELRPVLHGSVTATLSHPSPSRMRSSGSCSTPGPGSPSRRSRASTRPARWPGGCSTRW